LRANMCPFIWLATSSPHYTTFPAHAFGGLVHPIRLIISKTSPVTPFSLHALWGPLLAFIGPGEALRHVEAGLDISDPICLSCLLEWVIAFRLDKDLCPVQPPSSTLLHTIWVVSLVGSADLVPIPMGSIRGGSDKTLSSQSPRVYDLPEFLLAPNTWLPTSTGNSTGGASLILS